MNKCILFASMICALLAGCGGSGGGSSNSGSTNAQTEPTEKLLTADGLEVMANSLTLANQLQDSLAELKSKPKTVPFLSRLNEGDEAILVANGPISLKASCDEYGDLRVVYSSSEPTTTLAATEIFGYLNENYSYTWEVLQEDGNAKILRGRNSLENGLLIAATGDAMLIDGGTIIYGTDVQGSACFVAGLTRLMTGEQAPEFNPF